jgi:hypothetical protein
MPRTAADIENYLDKLGRTYEATGATSDTTTLLIQSGADLPVIALRVAPPIVAINVAIGPAPKDDAHQLSLYRRLLELNATDLMHASYGLENGKIVLSSALVLDNLDENELDAALSDIDVALVRHTGELVGVARD